MPKVTISIPLYNYAAYLPAAIESALAQTYSDFELLILDERSTDGSSEIAQQYAARDARIRYVLNPERAGMVGNFNRCVTEARGEYVKILCADDVLEPRCLEVLVGLLERFPQCNLATSARNLVRDDLTPIRTLRKRVPYDTPIDGRDVMRISLGAFNFIGEPSTVMIRREAVKGLVFDERFHQMLDFEAWLRLVADAPLLYSPEVLSAFRWHGANESVLKQPEAWAAYDLLKISTNLSPRGGVYPPASTFAIKRLQLMCFARGAIGVGQAVWQRNVKGLRACSNIVANAVRSLVDRPVHMDVPPFLARPN